MERHRGLGQSLVRAQYRTGSLQVWVLDTHSPQCNPEQLCLPLGLSLLL